ncbi:hypothetical protein RhoFasGS6_04686 [Rhodococcus fascians]|nr:hypothetical protein [Rhodococcus fascians]
MSVEAQHEPAQQAWPTGFKEFLVCEFTDFSPLVTRAMEDNCASLFHDGPYGRSGFWRTFRSVFREFVWPV